MQPGWGPEASVHIFAHSSPRREASARPPALEHMAALQGAVEKAAAALNEAVGRDFIVPHRSRETVPAPQGGWGTVARGLGERLCFLCVFDCYNSVIRGLYLTLTHAPRTSGGDGENPARGEEEQSTEEKEPSEQQAGSSRRESLGPRQLSDLGTMAGVIRAVAPRSGKQPRPASYTSQPEHICIPVTLECFDHPKRYRLASPSTSVSD